MDSQQPSIQGNVRILKDCAYCDRELLTASAALPDSGPYRGFGILLRLEPIGFPNQSTKWTKHSIRPTLRLKEFPCGFRVRESLCDVFEVHLYPPELESPTAIDLCRRLRTVELRIVESHLRALGIRQHAPEDCDSPATNSMDEAKAILWGCLGRQRLAHEKWLNERNQQTGDAVRVAGLESQSERLLQSGGFVPSR